MTRWCTGKGVRFGTAHDVIAAGDLALQEGARMLFGLQARPTERALRQMAQAWSPWRAVAARGLWAYYRVAKGREGIS